MSKNAGTINMGGGKIAQTSLPVEIFQEGKVYVAHCPALRLASHGPTREAAQAALKEAVGIFFEEIERMGTLENVLVECGWQRDKPSGKEPPRLIPPRITTSNISVPASIPLPV